jgi:hypothetical protein
MTKKKKLEGYGIVVEVRVDLSATSSREARDKAERIVANAMRLCCDTGCSIRGSWEHHNTGELG